MHNPLTKIAYVAADSIPASGFDAIEPFVNVGIVGIILLCIVFRKFFVPEWVLKDAEARHQRELDSKEANHKREIDAKAADIAELKKMVADGAKQLNDQVIPAFTRSIDVNREYVELLRTRRLPPQDG